MFHPALMMLIRLQWRGGFRQFRRSLRTFRGLFQFGFIVAMLLYGVGSMYFVGGLQSGSPALPGMFDTIQNDFLALGLFVGTCCVVLFSSGEAAVYFTASEVAFLFPAPVTRKQLLTYKLLKSFMGIIAISLFFMFFSVSNIHLALPRLIGTVLTLAFIQLLTMNVAFARQILHEKMHLMIRRVLGIVLGLLILIALKDVMDSAAGADLSVLVKAFHNSSVGQSLLAPFAVFTRMLRMPDLSSFLTSCAIVLVIDGLLLAMALRLDALSLESAFALSEKMTARIKSIQTKGVWQAFGTTSAAVAKRRIPQLPYWGGIGPVVWQRMTTTFRASTQLVSVIVVALLVATGLVYFFSKSQSGGAMAPIFGVGSMAYMSFLICLTLQNDIERVGLLKSLPIRTVSIVIGELLGFVVLLSTIQILFIAAIVGCFPTHSFWLVCAMSLTFPLNFLLFAVDKLVFYIYPTRLAKGAPGDFQNSGKQMIFMALKMCILGGCALVMGLATLPGALILESPLAAIASAALVLLVECIVVVPFVITAFDRFDPSVTMIN